MSPEQITGKPITPATDIYALGVILYRMYTTRLPFRGESPGVTGSSTATRVTYEHVNIPPVPPISLYADLDLAVQEVVLRCLEKNPARRYPSVDEIYDALSEAVGAPPLAVAPAVKAEEVGEAPPVRPPEWSQFMAPVTEEAAKEAPVDPLPLRPAIEHPVPLPRTEPHLEQALKESERTMASQGPADTPPTLVSLGRVAQEKSRTLVHQQVEPIPAARVSPPSPGHVAPPHHSRTARKPKRHWTTLAVVIGVVLLAMALCVATIYLLQS
jgi:serine/threonine protein kinase